MGEGLVSALFNRAILDLVVGSILLALAQLAGEIFSWDAIGALDHSEVSRWSALIVIGSGFVAGTVLDRLAFLAFDRKLFGRSFRERTSSYDLPDWAARIIYEVLNDPAHPTQRINAGIDESGTDLLVAIFWAEGKPEAIAKRADLIANYQFVSNLMLDSVVAVIVLPAWSIHANQGGLVAIAVLLPTLLSVLLWRASLAAIGRIHTFENVVVVGVLAGGWRPDRRVYMLRPGGIRRTDRR